MKQNMTSNSFFLSRAMRDVVKSAIYEVCRNAATYFSPSMRFAPTHTRL
jgi:hypothetical protein